MKQVSTKVQTENCDQWRNDWANLARYRDDNKRLLTLPAAERKVVFMGNSITEGWTKFDAAFFKDKGYINRGISGQTTPQMLIRFRQDVIALNPKVVVILAGINDIAENTGPIALEDIFGNISSMAELARAHNIKVVLSAVLPAYDFPWRKGMNPAEKVMKLNSMLKEYANKNKFTYVDYHTAMTDNKGGLQEKLGYDGVHPNLEGYKVMEPLAEQGIAHALKH